MLIFNNKHAQLQQELDINGFVKIPLLSVTELQEIMNIYEHFPNAKNNNFGFHVTLDLPSSETINTISENIKNIIDTSVGSYFDDFKYISPRFAVKEAHENSFIPPHQDWSFVDEKKFQSYNLWIAITPSTYKNGTLGFLKKSHNKLSNIRATPLPIFKVPFHDYAMELTDKLEYIELNAGEALIFNSRIIHASKPNITAEKRINISVELTNKDAQLIHYNLIPDNKTISKYNIDDSFFSKYSNAKLTVMYRNKQPISDFKSVEKINNTSTFISKSDLLDIS